MNATGSPNIFQNYQQQENHFTNSLMSLLNLSKHEDPEFLQSFLKELLALDPACPIDDCRVLRGFTGTADAQLCGEGCCIRFETKIRSATVRPEQLRAHLDHLHARPERLRRLVLLTPDDEASQYVQRQLAIDPEHIVHLDWRNVYRHLRGTVTERERSPLFSALVRQFLERIHECVFAEDIAGVVAKIDFGDRSGVYSDRYLDEMAKGEWTRWNTPGQYKSLDGTGRKLLLYDRSRGITVEAEISEVRRTDCEARYPWSNSFVPGRVLVYPKPIPLTHIRTVAGFECFGVYRRDRSPYRNITHEQYRRLMEYHRE